MTEPSEIPSDSPPAVEANASAPRLGIKEAKTRLKQAKLAVKIAKKSATQAKNEVKTLKKALKKSKAKKGKRKTTPATQEK